MLTMIEELIRHKWWANANLLRGIKQHPPAAEDEELRKMLHHILVSNRFWLFAIVGRTFVREDEMQIPVDLAGIIARFKETERLESDWLQKRASRTLSPYWRPAPPDWESMFRFDRQFCRFAFTPRDIVLNVQRDCAHSVEPRPAWIMFCG